MPDVATPPAGDRATQPTTPGNKIVHSMQSGGINDKLQRSIAMQRRRRSWDDYSNLNAALDATLQTLLRIIQLPYMPVVSATARARLHNRLCDLCKAGTVCSTLA